MPKNLLALAILLASLSLSWCVYRDLQLEKQYPGDLRNRVVGARLQMDGIPPYYFHWYPGDTIRYYDPENYQDRPFSSITATPFFHQLLYPIANLSQRTISYLWLAIEYLCLAVMVLLACRIATNKNQKILILLFSLLFLHTQFWVIHITQGQLYLVIPAITFLFCYLLRYKNWLPGAFFAGILAATAILIRPNFVFFFLPLLLLIPLFTKKYLVTLFISSALLASVAFIGTDSRSYWDSYRHAMKDHLALHQGTYSAKIDTPALPLLQNWEGWDFTDVKRRYSSFAYPSYSEHANIFVLHRMFLKKKISPTLLAVLLVLLSGIVLLCYYLRFKKDTPFHLPTVFLLGYCLYMFADLFSPVHRHLYNGVQWLFPLLWISANYKLTKYAIALLLISLCLAVSIPRVLPMQATIGEYIILGVLLSIVFAAKQVSNEHLLDQPAKFP